MIFRASSRVRCLGEGIVASRNRGKRKPNLRDLSQEHPTRSEKDSVRAQAIADNASPIVAAILGVSLVECELDSLLRRKFKRQDDETWSILTGDSGPLGTLSAKIIAAHAFGIIDDVVRDGLADSTRQCIEI